MNQRELDELAGFSVEVGAAVGALVSKRGRSDADAGSVLLVLAVGLLSASGATEQELRELFQGALMTGPFVWAQAQRAKGGEA